MDKRSDKVPLENERNKLVSAVLDLPPESPDLPRVIAQLLLDLIFVTEGTNTELALAQAYSAYAEAMVDLQQQDSDSNGTN